MEKENQPQKNRLKILLKTAGWIVIGLIVLLVLAALFLQTGPGEKFVLTQVQKVLEEQAGLKLKAEGLSLNIFSLKLTISGLKLIPTEESRLPIDWIACEKISLRSGWSTLVGGQIRVRDLEIVSPEINLMSPGRQPAPQASPKQVEEKKATASDDRLSFRIDRFRLEKGFFSYQEPVKLMATELSDLTAAIDFDETSDSHLIEILSGGGRIATKNGQTVITSLLLKATLSQNKINLDNLSLSTAGSEFSLTGKVENFLSEAPSLDLRTSGNLSLAELNNLLSPAEQYSGEVNWEIEARGKATWPDLTGTIAGSGLELFGLSPVDLKLGFKPAAESVTMINGQVNLKEGNLNLEVRVPPALEGLFSSFLVMENIDLSLLSTLSPDFPVELGSKLSGRIEIGLPELSVEKARGQANLNLIALSAENISPEMSGQKPVVPVAGDLRLSYSEKLLDIEKAELEFLSSKLSLNGKMEKNEQLSGKLSWRLEDLQAVVKALHSTGLSRIIAGLGEQLKFLEGSLLVEAEASGQISAPEFNLSLNGRDLGFRQFFLPSLEIDTEGNLHQLSLNQLTLKLTSGLISGKGKFSQSVSGKTSAFDLDGELELLDVDLAQFASLLSQETRPYLNGILSGSLQLAGATDQPKANFELNLSGTEAGSLKLETVEIKGEYDNKELKVEKIDLRLPESQILGNFSVKLETGEIQADLTGQKLKATSIQTWFPAIQAGQLDFELTASGFWKTPVADLKITGQGFMIDRIWFPYFELQAKADGQKAEANFIVPRFNLSLASQIELNEPYLLSGLILIQDLPLASLAGILPEVEETTTLVALSARTRFEVPIQKMEEMEVEFRFENFDFAGLAVLVPALKPMNPGGRADGRIVWQGFSPDLKGVEVLVDIPELNLVLNGMAIKNESPLTIILKDQVLQVENFVLQSGKSRLRLSGNSTLSNLKNPGLSFRLDGDLNLSDFNPWLTGMVAGGNLKLEAGVKGDMISPVIEGEGIVENIFVRMEELPIVVSNLGANFKIDNSRLVLEGLKGLANSGTFSGSGLAEFGQNFALTSARVNLELNNFDFNYPQGFSSLSAARLSLSQEKRGWQLAGDLSLLSASYREDFYPSTQGLKMLFARVSPAGTEYPAFLYEMALDVNIQTVENITIKNNLADLELKANLNLKGTVPAPILSGRIETAYTGEIIVGERKYTVERVKIDFLGRENLEPNLDILLKSTVYDLNEEVEASLILSGTPSDLNFSLTSTPARSQSDLASLLLTGKNLGELQGSALNTISGQFVQYFSSPLTSPVTKTLKKWLKAEEVVLEPLNIATLQDPGARMTIRKKMTREFAVTYSIDLTNSQYQTWIFDYQLRRNFSTRGFRRDDGVVGLNLRHKLSFGQKASPTEVKNIPQRKIELIEINGEPVFPPERLLKELKIKSDQTFSDSKLKQGLERLKSFYRKHGYFNVKIATETEEIDDYRLNLRLEIQANQPVEFKFSGDKIPRGVRKKVINSWVSRLPEGANLYQQKSILLKELNRRGYYKAEIEVKAISQEEKLVYEFYTNLNGKWKIGDFKLDGNPVFGKSLIKQVVSDYFGARAKGLWNLVYDPKVSLGLIQYFYEENGYLQVKIEEPVVEEDYEKRLVNLTLNIEAGPQSRVQWLQLEGNDYFTADELTANLNLKAGSVFSWPALNISRTALINHYRSAGFKDVKVEAQAEPVDSGPDYKAKFIIEEGQIYKISDIEIAGDPRSKPSYVRKESGLKPGEPISLERLAQAQKNLYDAGVFRSVNINSVSEPGDDYQEKVLISLQEMPRFSLTYGLQYNTDTKFEGFGQLDFNNLFGRGWNSLLFFRANNRQQDARASLKIPYIFSKKTDSLLSAFYLKDIKDLYITEETGASFQQKLTVVRGFDISWVYRFSRIHDYEREPSWFFPYDVKVFSSELSILLNRDTRDDRFDPRQGSLLTASFSYSPRFLGSTLNYVRSFTQFSMYKSIWPGVTWASCYRLGLASAFGETLIPAKRFFAGGGTSIRGFKLDAVGPVDFWSGLPEGGEGMIVVNQELRFPIYKLFSGVAFFDAGNVYSRLADINPTRLRTGAGFGLRIDTPLGLIRVDYGFNLKPRPGEAKGGLFFSIGQAF
ncbi:MAG: translocation/assembly module TamB domain-containing protein [Acidobacteriota bacterium]|nr:translocation/assembly module TamB domain-containing protein [Acidobacteriota bacterium]